MNADALKPAALEMPGTGCARCDNGHNALKSCVTAGKLAVAR
jgi:hypothetical protein